MQTHDENQETTAALTTEDLARTGRDDDTMAAEDAAGADGMTTPVYPGEATGDGALGASGIERDAAVPAERAGGPDAGTDAGTDARTDARTDAGTGEEPLLAADEAERYRTAWSDIQVQFVDDPRQAVTSADGLVAEVMQILAGTFSTRKKELEEQWHGGGDVETEELRLALQQYRSFFNRLLKT